MKVYKRDNANRNKIVESIIDIFELKNFTFWIKH